jgi:hypothetical protein
MLPANTIDSRDDFRIDDEYGFISLTPDEIEAILSATFQLLTMDERDIYENLSYHTNFKIYPTNTRHQNGQIARETCTKSRLHDDTSDTACLLQASSLINTSRKYLASTRRLDAALTPNLAS